MLAPLLSLERRYHTVSPDEAHAIITDLVTREVAVIEEIDGQPVCSKDLSVGDQILVFLYRAGRDAGLEISELQRQLRHNHKSNLTTAVKRLDGKGLVLLHPQTNKAHITSMGLADVEARELLRPA